MSVCPDPAGCPVAPFATLAAAPRHTVDAGSTWFHSYSGTWGYDEANPGKGSPTRFAPFRSAAGDLVPTMYLAANDTGALLETIFHDLGPGDFILEDTLRTRLLAEVDTPFDLNLVDLRDTALASLSVTRDQIASSPSEHYPCTGLIAQGFHQTNPDIQGLIWDSRQVELQLRAGATVTPCDVVIVFTDRVPADRGDWPAHNIMSLHTGAGRTVIDEVATSINANVITS